MLKFMKDLQEVREGSRYRDAQHKTRGPDLWGRVPVGHPTDLFFRGTVFRRTAIQPNPRHSRLHDVHAVTYRLK